MDQVNKVQKSKKIQLDKDSSDEKEEGSEDAKRKKVKKMNNVQTFFALCKNYCAINILLTPKAFTNGGYIVSPIVMIIACTLMA